MRCHLTCRGWTRLALGFIFLILASANFAAGPQGNRITDADAAASGKRTPGPTPIPDLPAVDGRGVTVAQGSLQSSHQDALRKMRFDKMKEHAAQLAEMARSLQEELDHSNQNILPVQVVEKAKKIQKLAGKIRSEARF